MFRFVLSIAPPLISRDKNEETIHSFNHLFVSSADLAEGDLHACLIRSVVSSVRNYYIEDFRVQRMLPPSKIHCTVLERRDICLRFWTDKSVNSFNNFLPLYLQIKKLKIFTIDKTKEAMIQPRCLGSGRFSEVS